MEYNMCNITCYQTHSPKTRREPVPGYLLSLDISKSLPIFEWYNAIFTYRYILHRCAGYVFSERDREKLQVATSRYKLYGLICALSSINAQIY